MTHSSSSTTIHRVSDFCCSKPGLVLLSSVALSASYLLARELGFVGQGKRVRSVPDDVRNKNLRAVLADDLDESERSRRVGALSRRICAILGIWRLTPTASAQRSLCSGTSALPMRVR